MQMDCSELEAVECRQLINYVLLLLNQTEGNNNCISCNPLLYSDLNIYLESMWFDAATSYIFIMVMRMRFAVKYCF